VFQIRARPEHVKEETIYNVNTRGKRGNIVQAYPAVEYDFVPQELSVNNGDYLHIQWSGSDFNTKRNPNNAEGWEYSDRHNLVQTADLNTQFPIPLKDQTFFNWEETAKRFAWADSDTELGGLINKNTGHPYECRIIPMPSVANGNQGSDKDQNDPTNCGKLNWAPARFDGGLMAVKQKPGNYFFTSTRNNNFSNRSPKWHLTIFPFADNGQHPVNVAVPVVFGLLFGVALIAAGLYLFVKFRSAGASTSDGIGKGKRTYQSLLKDPTTESEQAESDRGRV